MSLTSYQRKRRFDKTPEPAGKPGVEGGFSYAVQKHDASHLHYDFRLELDGVLKSWAVPKGPSLDPTIKRLAVHVEDHPVEYGAFEGTIPKGQYGGGTVMLWDQGMWEPVGDPQAGYRAGKLKFALHGQKLRGLWMLVKTKGFTQGKTDERSWLLIKERDDEARDVNEGDVLETDPFSVATGRGLEEIASGAAVRRSRMKVSRKGAAGYPKKALHPASEDKDYDAKRETFAGIRFTSPDKVLYPEEGLTKLDLAHYYRAVASWILPHIKDRPLSFFRCPEGRSKEGFFQKHPGAGTPKNLKTFPIVEKSKTEDYVLVDDVEGLISLAQMGVLEIHAWGSRTDKLEQPDRLIFDLDPDPQIPWRAVVESARAIRELLEVLELESFVKTTGGKGLHLVVPIRRELEWDEVKAFCKRVADYVVSLDSKHFTSNMSMSSRRGKIYVDYLRNDRGATAVVPYSPRARAGAPISCPLAWEELTTETHSEKYAIANVEKRLAKLKHDPWKKISQVRQSVKTAQRKLAGLFR